MPQAKTEVALQFSECCAAEVALQHSLFCSADVILTKAALQQAKNCTATSKKLRCRKVALSCHASCGFQAPTFRDPRFGPAEFIAGLCFGCGFFAYSWKLPAYSGAFVLTVGNLSFRTHSWSLFTYSFSFSTYNWSFLLTVGKCV